MIFATQVQFQYLVQGRVLRSHERYYKYTFNGNLSLTERQSSCLFFSCDPQMTSEVKFNVPTTFSIKRCPYRISFEISKCSILIYTENRQAHTDVHKYVLDAYLISHMCDIHGLWWNYNITGTMQAWWKCTTTNKKMAKRQINRK